MPSRKRAKKVVYFDCPSGVAGNMTIGALLDAGLDFSWFEKHVSRLPISGYELIFERRSRNGVSGVYFDVDVRKHGHHHRRLREIRSLIAKAELPKAVKKRSLSIFRELAEAEAKVHKTGIEDVHFHEVGAVDAIIDVVGTSLCLDALEIDEIHGSAVNVGHGKGRSDHGWFSLPAPATLEMLRRRRIPFYPGDKKFEMSTPTGIAILGSQALSFAGLPPMTVERHSYGFGSRSFPNHANALHLVSGRR